MHDWGGNLGSHNWWKRRGVYVERAHLLRKCDGRLQSTTNKSQRKSSKREEIGKENSNEENWVKPWVTATRPGKRGLRPLPPHRKLGRREAQSRKDGPRKKTSGTITSREEMRERTPKQFRGGFGKVMIKGDKNKRRCSESVKVRPKRGPH